VWQQAFQSTNTIHNQERKKFFYGENIVFLNQINISPFLKEKDLSIVKLILTG